jgi:hypothetical protein
MTEIELEKIFMNHPVFNVTLPQILSSLKRIESALDIRRKLELQELIQENKPKYEPENVEKAARYVREKISAFHEALNQPGQHTLTEEGWAQYNILTDINRLLKGLELRRPGQEEHPIE